jgi:PAS domain S-box-containing protein
LVSINEAAEKMLGYTKEELENLSTEVVHVDREHYEEFGRWIQGAFDRGELANFEFKLKRKNGEIFPTEHTVSLLRGEAEEPLGIVSVVRDITERKRAEEALRSLKEFNENVVQSIQDGLVSIDRDFRITFWNKAMEQLRGYTADEVQGKVITEQFPHLSEQGVDELLHAALSGHVAEGRNFSYQLPDGKTVYTNARLLPLKDQAGTVIGVLSILEDVTELLQRSSVYPSYRKSLGSGSSWR